MDKKRFIDEIVEELKYLEKDEPCIKRKAHLANIVGRLGTFNEVYYQDNK